jgi:uncharacterized protein
MKPNFSTIAALLLPFFFCSTTQAQTPKSLLWEVSGNGLAAPSYLYGTMHVGDKRAYRFSKSVMPSFEKASAFAMEIDPGTADPISLMNMMKLKEGKLQDMFTAEEWQELKDYMQSELQTDLEKLNDFSPFFIYSMISQTKFSNQKGQALDLYFFSEAKKDKKTIHGLESVEEQISAINRMKPEDQKKMLLEGISEEEKGDKTLSQMMKYYAKGDLDKLQAMSDDADYGDEFESAMILERNHTMTERMEPLMKAQSTFVAVGALHLPGEEGILKLLEKEGYQVRPLK